MNNTNCKSCHHSLPQSATFCPFCGIDAATRAPYNAQLEVALFSSEEDEEPLDMLQRPGRGPSVKLFAGVAITGAVIAGIFAGGWLADVVYRPDVAPSPQVAQTTVATPSDLRGEIAVSKNATGGFDVTVGAEVLHTVSTSNGSRYENLDERMRSVAVRFKHVQGKETGKYAARLVGDHYELVWANADGDFRILDVTSEDVGAKDGSADLTANLLVDRLNAELPAPSNS